MAKDPEHQPELGQREELGDESEGGGEPAERSFEQPLCPRCGWHNTRLSHTSTLLDNLAGVFGLRAFRCRSCGNRFRAMRRSRKR